MDEAFDFNELIFRILRRWRFIISVSVVLAVLTAGYGAFSQMTDESNIPITSLEISDADEASSDADEAQQRYEELQRRFEKLETYINESIRMKIEPYNEYVHSITFLVRSEALDRDRAVDLAILYARLQNDDNLYEMIKNAAGIDIAPSYFRELISWVTSSTSFEVRIIGPTPELTRAIAEIVTSYYAEQNQRIRQYAGEHSLELVSQGEYSVVSPSQDTYQNSMIIALNNLESEIKAESENIKAMSENANTEPENITAIIVKSLLYAVMGGVGGIGIGVLLLLYLDSVRMSVLSDKDISKRYNLCFLGSVSKERNRNV